MNTLMHPTDRLSSARLINGGLAALAAAGLVAIGLGVVAPATAATPDIPAGAHFASWADNGKADDNGKAGERVLQLVKGELPTGTGAVTGVVKTDTDCDQDKAGLNHCRNVITLASGGEIEVVLHHRNMRSLCLSPGDRLTLARLDGDWLVAKDD